MKLADQDLVHPADAPGTRAGRARRHSLSSVPTRWPAVRDAGCTRSPAASRTRVTGCCASQSISRSGAAVRSSVAIATSRRAWPRPIGEERYSARRRRCVGADPVRVPLRPADVTASTNRRIIMLTRTGSRAMGACPAPSIRVSDAPVRSASCSPTACALIRSAVPWTTCTGQRTDFANSSNGSAARRPGSRRASVVATSVSASMSADHDIMSSICLVECASGNISPKKCSRKSSRPPCSQCRRLYVWTP